MKLTLVVMKGEEYYVGTVKEIPGVLSQGSTIEEAREILLMRLMIIWKI